MTATLYLIGCCLAGGQAPAAPVPSRGDWVLVPRLARGQELVYRGGYAEEAGGGHAQFSRAYRLEARVFVLDTTPRGAEVAVLTVLRDRDPQPGISVPAGSACSVRLERARVDLQGRLSADGVNLLVPLEGPPLLECGAFLEAPAGRVGPGQAWDVAEPGRPLLVWRNTGTEMLSGTLCLKLAGVQPSEDWDRPRADRTAWRRRDTVWLSTRQGFAHRVERVVERREPARSEPTQVGRLRYDLDSSFQCPAPLAEDRRREIAQALALRDQLTPLLAQPGRSEAQLAALVKRIDYHLENQPPTPYREAVLQVRRHAEAARRGEVPAELSATSGPAGPSRAQPGELAPDFVASDLTAAGSARPRRWLGKPVLLVFYSPASTTAAEVLRFGQRLAAMHGPHLAVVGLSMSSDAGAVRRQREQLGVSFPVLDGGGLRISYEVESTPKFVLLDGANIVRGAWLGWGEETAVEVAQELKRWMAPPAQLPPTPGP
jgi:peroxiredoxin